MLSWLAPLVVFGIVVFVHELGHFIAAKLTGVYAPVFSLGWGSRAWGRKVGETDYRISWLPIGGYVRMASRDDETMAKIEGGGETELPAGEAGAAAFAETGHAKGMNPVRYDDRALAPFGPIPVPEDRWFESKAIWARVVILLAGVTMNALLTFAVLTMMFAVYGRPFVPPVVNEIVAGKPAAGAGLMSGDSIVAISGAPVESWVDVLEKITASPGKPITLDVRRNGARVVLTMTPEPTPGQDPATGEAITVGRIGAGSRDPVRRNPVSLGQAVVEGWNSTWDMAGSVLKVVRGLVTGAVSVKQLGGPIAIARTSVQAARGGIEPLLFLIAFLSINIAILNLLPIPLLDGGNIVINIVEAIKGKAFSIRTREYIMRAGLVVVLLLFVVVMRNDIMRLLGFAS